MRWKELITSIPTLKTGGAADPQVSDVTNDSHAVTPGAVFIATPGLKSDGLSFVNEAIGRGAVAVVCEREPDNCAVPWAMVPDSREVTGLLARSLWNDPAAGSTMVGITGTNGKTTTAYLYQHLFAQLYGPEYSWMFGTVMYMCGGKPQPASHTTPEAVRILRLLSQAATRPKALTMEVSSHALQLNRIAGLRFDLAVWTNLTQDHLDFHKTMDDYYQAKKRLFTSFLKPGATMIVNVDDAWGRRLVEDVPSVATMTYGRIAQAACRIRTSRCTWDGTDVAIDCRGQSHLFRSKLTGGFNVDNMTALIAGAFALDFPVAAVQRCFDTMPQVPGRMERVAVARDYTVVVDYAHTPDALEKVLSAARSLTKGRLLCVFGCGGDRDRTKRPRMAEAVASHCDEAVVTSDNPRSEEPDAIIAEVVAGMPLDFTHQVIADRRSAIKRAMAIARPGDCIVVAGKGHEDYQEIKGVRHHFDDRETVRELAAEGRE
jgi:UDP-N-acetylmuramoyl-L-alanyl-D-glutamate--2,6-diaminopimelate ligase